MRSPHPHALSLPLALGPHAPPTWQVLLGAYGSMSDVSIGDAQDPTTTADDPTFGYSALMRAAAIGHRDMVQALLDAGADPALKLHRPRADMEDTEEEGKKKTRTSASDDDEEGMAAHELASKNGHERVERMLMQVLPQQVQPTKAAPARKASRVV